MSEDGYIYLTDDIIKNSIQERKAVFDKNGEEHYDNISAFIKSMRGSDPDAAVFYLARALNRWRRSNVFSKKDYNMCIRRCRNGKS